MSFTAKLFSFEGRIGRGEWWMLGGLVFVVQFLIFLLIFMSQGGFGPPTIEGLDKSAMVSAAQEGAGFGGFVTAVLIAALAGLWPNLAINVKRWHDRDKGGVWMLINFIPWIGPLWATTELGLLPGTAGSNRFGPGPGQTGSLADVFDEPDEDTDSRAAAAIARWTQAAPLSRSAAPTQGFAAHGQPSGGGFGKRTAAPRWG